MTHIPVMLNEVIDALAPRDGGIYVDGTFGCGGYSKAILEAADCKVFGIDRDPDAVEIAHEFEKKYDGRFSIIHGCFGDMAELMQENGVESVDGVVLDIGVSSPQINTPERGFSFRLDGLLDMRMAQDGTSAADVVNNMDETDLANIIYRYGEERKSNAKGYSNHKLDLGVIKLHTRNITSVILPENLSEVDENYHQFSINAL